MYSPISINQLSHTKVDTLGNDSGSFVGGQSILGHNELTRLRKGVLHGFVNVGCTVYVSWIVCKRLQVISLGEPKKEENQIR